MLGRGCCCCKGKECCVYLARRGLPRPALVGAAELLVCAGAEGKRPGVSYEALLASLEFGDSNVLAEVAAAREAALAAMAVAGRAVRSKNE